MRSDMEFWKEVRREVLTGQLSQREACRKYGLGWHTLKKILEHDAPPGYRQSQPRKKRKLEPFLPVIFQILEDDRQAPKKQRHTAHRIFERLRPGSFQWPTKTAGRTTSRSSWHVPSSRSPRSAAGTHACSIGFDERQSLIICFYFQSLVGMNAQCLRS